MLAIPVKREDKKLIGHLTRAEIQALLDAPNRACWPDRRDHALLLTLYNSGARVSEITSLTCHQVSFGASTFVQLTGKARKERTVPLWPETRQVLRLWFNELGDKSKGIAFPSARGKPLSRDGVDYLLKQAIQRALPTCPSLRGRDAGYPAPPAQTRTCSIPASGSSVVLACAMQGNSLKQTPADAELP